jgi:hypothetical protein
MRLHKKVFKNIARLTQFRIKRLLQNNATEKTQAILFTNDIGMHHKATIRN